MLLRALPSLPLLAFALVAVGGCTSHQIVRRGEVNDAALERVQKRTSAARGLPFKDDVEVEAYTQEESGEYIAQRYSGADPEADRQDDVVAHRLGILPDGVSLSDLFRRTLTQNAAGVYRPKEKTLYIVTDLLPGPMRIPLQAVGMLTGTDWNQELVLSHELVHALQDQHFDLDGHVLPGRIWGANEDMGLARKSIVESEANIVSQAYLLSVPLDRPASRNLLISYLALFNDLNVLMTRWMTPGLPPFYAKLFVEQYTQGMRFVQAATNRGGWGTLGEAYRRGLPRSTEQMMTPAKYFGSTGPKGASVIDEPVPLVAIDVDTRMPETLSDYVALEDNVFGALLWRIYFDDYMGRGNAISAATGWGGDRYSVFEERLPSDPLRQPAAQVPAEGTLSEGLDAIGEKVGADGVTPEKIERRSTLVWRTQWDTAEDAKEFFLAYGAVLVGKYPGRTVMVEQSDRAIVVDVSPPKSDQPTKGVRTHAFEKAGVFLDGMRAVVIEGADPTKFEAWKTFAWALNHVDENALEERNRGEGIYAAPPPPKAGEATLAFARPKEMPLSERVALPHHRAVFRFGFGASFDERIRIDNRARFSLVADRELRWGFRQHLEWAPPLVFSLDVTGAAANLPATETGERFVQMVVSAGVVDVSLGRAFGEDLVVLIAPAFAVTQRVGLPGVSVIAQARAVGDLVTHADIAQRATFDVAGALYVAPFAFAPKGVPIFGDDPGRLVLTLGAGATYAFDDVGATLRGLEKAPTPRTFVLGAATTRGFVPQPTVEFRVLDAVFLYEMSRVFVDAAALEVTTHEHVAGVLFRF